MGLLQHISQNIADEFDKILTAIVLPKLTNLSITYAQIDEQQEHFFYYRNMLASTARMMTSILNNEKEHPKDVETSLMFPANPTIHKVVKETPIFKAINDVLIILLDSKKNPDKYTANEHDDIKNRVELAVKIIYKIYDRVTSK